MEYIKKAKGDLFADCQCEIPEVPDSIEYTVKTEIKDSSGEIVAVGTFYWLLSRKV